MTVETEVRFATPADQNKFAEELTQAVAAVVAKYHDDKTPGGRRFRFVVGGHPAPTVSRAAKLRGKETAP